MRLSEKCAVCLYDKQKRLTQDEDYLAEVRELLDKLFLEQLAKRFPQLEMNVLVRGDVVLNDATPEDAVYAGIDRLAQIVSNGAPVPGTVYKMLPQEARRVLDTADVILAKGQGNYESLSHQGRHIFYVFTIDLFCVGFFN